MNPRRIVSANKSLIYYHLNSFNLAIKANQKISMVAIKLLMLLYVTHISLVVPRSLPHFGRHYNQPPTTTLLPSVYVI